MSDFGPMWDPTHPPLRFRTHIAEISSLGLLTPNQKFLKKRVFSHFHKFRTLDPPPTHSLGLFPKKNRFFLDAFPKPI